MPVSPTMSKRTTAEIAVLYVLKRIQEDANVYYYLGLGTESFERLCRAEAEMTGETEEAVRDRRARCTDASEADVVRLRKEFDGDDIPDNDPASDRDGSDVPAWDD